MLCGSQAHHARQLSLDWLFLEPQSPDSGTFQCLEEVKLGEQAKTCSGHLVPSTSRRCLHKVSSTDFSVSLAFVLEIALLIKGTFGSRLQIVILARCLKPFTAFIPLFKNP